MKNYRYLKLFLKEFCIVHKELKFENLYKKLLEEFPDINITVTNEEKKIILENYKNKLKSQKDNISDSKEINFNEILNIKILLKKTMMNTTKFLLSKKNIRHLIMDMTDINGYKLTTLLKVEFTRKNKVYNKEIFILMNESMKKNILDKDNIQFFCDTTYDTVPPQNSHMKLFVILAYNKNKNKISLCALSLIKNENTETLESIFRYLKINYYFNPPLTL